MDRKKIEPQSATEAPTQTQLHIPQRLRRAFLSISRFGDSLLSPYGITSDQYSLLLAVYRESGIRQADLGDAMFAEANTITAMVTLLEKRGLLRRKSSPTDGRAKLIHLTARGEKLTEKLSGEARHLRKLLYDCFEGEDGLTALRILDRVSEEMQKARASLVSAGKGLDLDQGSPDTLRGTSTEARILPSRTLRKKKSGRSVAVSR
jgi:DNA-binding MarR family transcriptional regulator